MKNNNIGAYLRSKTVFLLPQVKFVKYGLKALAYF